MVTKDKIKKEIKKILFDEEPSHSFDIPYSRITSFVYACAIAVTTYLYVNLYDNYPHILKNRQELDKILGYETVLDNEIRNAIINNENLPEEYKEAALELLEEELRNHPNSDLRIFYENIKDMMLEEIEPKEFKKLYPGIAGFYDFMTNTIHTTTDATRETKLHELRHSFDHFKIRVNGRNYIVTTAKGDFLDEAMTNKQISELTKVNTYRIEGRILEYFMTFTNYTYEDYQKTGINTLIEKLKEKYPEVKVNDLIRELDKMCDSDKKNITTTYLSEKREVLYELFKICLAEIKNCTEETKYNPFIEFSKLLVDEGNTDLLMEYLSLYNEELITLGYKPINKEELHTIYKPYQDCIYLAYQPGVIIPIKVEDNKGINLDTKKEIDYREFQYVEIPYLEYMIKSCALKYPNEVGTPRFWIHLNEEYHLISPVLYELIPIYYNNTLITYNYISNLTLKISVDDIGNISYALFNSKNELLFQIGELNIENISVIPLKEYMDLYIDKNRLDLEDILNDNYLLEAFKRKSIRYNFDYKDGQFVIRDNYFIVFSENPSKRYYMKHCAIITTEENNLMLVMGDGYEIPLESKTDEGVYFDLKTVLKSLGIFNEEQIEYCYSKEKLKNLCEIYIYNLNHGTRAR